MGEGRSLRWCDLGCEHASFPEEEGVDGAGSCRTFAALRCALLDRLVYKNDRCRAGLTAEGVREEVPPP